MKLRRSAEIKEWLYNGYLSVEESANIAKNYRSRQVVARWEGERESFIFAAHVAGDGRPEAGGAQTITFFTLFQMNFSQERLNFFEIIQLPMVLYLCLNDFHCFSQHELRPFWLQSLNAGRFMAGQTQPVTCEPEGNKVTSVSVQLALECFGLAAQGESFGRAHAERALLRFAPTPACFHAQISSVFTLSAASEASRGLSRRRSLQRIPTPRAFEDALIPS